MLIDVNESKLKTIEELEPGKSYTDELGLISFSISGNPTHDISKRLKALQELFDIIKMYPESKYYEITSSQVQAYSVACKQGRQEVKTYQEFIKLESCPYCKGNCTKPKVVHSYNILYKCPECNFIIFREKY